LATIGFGDDKGKGGEGEVRREGGGELWKRSLGATQFTATHTSLIRHTLTQRQAGKDSIPAAVVCGDQQLSTKRENAFDRNLSMV
jgi:hypothetical protein